MQLTTEHYTDQKQRWPAEGEHILAQHDEASVLVYQAYRPAIGNYALQHGHFGGPDFSFGRMSWIKPNFLWMMYRSGWGTKEGQEIILGLRLRRSFFDALLQRAVPSSFDPTRYASVEEWKAAVQHSDIRLQWDPDHAPDGTKETRRAIQLGLRGNALQDMAGPQLLEVMDFSGFVAEQRAHAMSDWSRLQTPRETVYPHPTPAPPPTPTQTSANTSAAGPHH